MTSRKSAFQNKSESPFGFYPLSSTEREAGNEERYGVGLLSVGQVDAKHQWLACGSLLNYRLFHYDQCYIPTQLAVQVQAV